MSSRNRKAKRESGAFYRKEKHRRNLQTSGSIEKLFQTIGKN
ncbi:unnamed protein product, partial [Larinioides sclopetarius]